MADQLIPLTSDHVREFVQAEKASCRLQDDIVPMIGVTLVDPKSATYCYGMVDRHAKSMAIAILRILAEDGDDESLRALKAIDRDVREMI